MDEFLLQKKMLSIMQGAAVFIQQSFRDYRLKKTVDKAVNIVQSLLVEELWSQKVRSARDEDRAKVGEGGDHRTSGRPNGWYRPCRLRWEFASTWRPTMRS